MTKIDPKSTQNRPKLKSKIVLERDRRAKLIEDRFRVRFWQVHQSLQGEELPLWIPFWVVLGVKLGSIWGHVGSEIDSSTVPEGVQKRH